MISKFGVLLLVGYVSMSSAMSSVCFCTYEYNPICGTDGVTYANQCDFDCQRGAVEMAYAGECRAKREAVSVAQLSSCTCSRDQQPMCGTDGVTYGNPCVLNCAREANPDLYIDFPGPCSERPFGNDGSCTCTRNLEPVCASDGLTYGNMCLMKCAGAHLTVTHLESCESISLKY